MAAMTTTNEHLALAAEILYDVDDFILFTCAVYCLRACTLAHGESLSITTYWNYNNNNKTLTPLIVRTVRAI